MLSNNMKGGSQGPPPSLQASQQAQPPPFRTQFACITLNILNIIRLINFPEQEMQAVQQVASRFWGVKKVELYGRSRQIKLIGYPWADNPNGNDNARRLMLRIIERLYDMGWVLQSAIDISKKSSDKDTLVFRKQDPPPPPCDWFVVSLDSSDKLKIVDAPPHDLTAAILDTFRESVTSYDTTGNRLKMHFRGAPWLPNGEQAVTTRLMLLSLFEVFERFGFTVYASIDQSGSSDGDETDVIVCHRNKHWIPGDPIWHR